MTLKYDLLPIWTLEGPITPHRNDDLLSSWRNGVPGMRIAVGGFQHETNTFAPAKATWRDFAEGGGFPPLQSGAALLDAFTGMNLPIAGAIAALREAGHAPVPLVWAAATPSAHVTEEAYARRRSDARRALRRGSGRRRLPRPARGDGGRAPR
jgi:hypothetical protein